MTDNKIQFLMRDNVDLSYSLHLFSQKVEKAQKFHAHLRDSYSSSMIARCFEK